MWSVVAARRVRDRRDENGIILQCRFAVLMNMVPPRNTIAPFSIFTIYIVGGVVFAV